jgi:hypothetical protein
MGRAGRLVVVALAVVSCGGGEILAPLGPGEAGAAPLGCAPGTIERHDGCQPAGLPPDRICPPGSALFEGTCELAGVPPSACAPGFVHDGDAACEPVLPAAPCSDGSMALPGEPRCRPVAPCGAGRWGDAPVDAATEHVDGAYAGADSDGSAARPWKTIQAGIDAAAAGGLVVVAEGSYVENLLVSGKAVRLWGRCPSLVTVLGPGGAIAALEVKHVPLGVEIRRLAVTGKTNGVVVSGDASGVVLDELWIHDTMLGGLSTEDYVGPAEGMLRRSLVDRARGFGIACGGARLRIEDVAVRATVPAAFDLGDGLRVIPGHAGGPGLLEARRVWVERSVGAGVVVVGSEAILDGVVVRGTEPASPQATAGGVAVVHGSEPDAEARASLRRSLIEEGALSLVVLGGAEALVEDTVLRGLADGPPAVARGASVESLFGLPSKLTMRRTLVDRVRDMGVFLADSEATVEATVVRDVRSGPMGLGQGVFLQADGLGPAPRAIVQDSVIERAEEFGVVVQGDLLLEGSIVRDSGGDARPQIPVLTSGAGVQVQRGGTGEVSRLTVRASLLERNRPTGIAVLGCEALVEASEIRQTALTPVGTAGIGVHVQYVDGPARATVLGTLVEESHSGGVSALSAALRLEGSVVRRTRPRADGLLGDGAVAVRHIQHPAELEVVRSVIAESARAGIASFGASVHVEETELRCQDIDLAFEDALGVASSYEGAGLCGCPVPAAPCVPRSAGLAPPEPPPLP